MDSTCVLIDTCLPSSADYRHWMAAFWASGYSSFSRPSIPCRSPPGQSMSMTLVSPVSSASRSAMLLMRIAASSFLMRDLLVPLGDPQRVLALLLRAALGVGLKLHQGAQQPRLVVARCARGAPLPLHVVRCFLLAGVGHLLLSIGRHLSGPQCCDGRGLRMRGRIKFVHSLLQLGDDFPQRRRPHGAPMGCRRRR